MLSSSTHCVHQLPNKVTCVRMTRKLLSKVQSLNPRPNSTHKNRTGGTWLTTHVGVENDLSMKKGTLEYQESLNNGHLALKGMDSFVTDRANTAQLGDKVDKKGCGSWGLSRDYFRGLKSLCHHLFVARGMCGSCHRQGWPNPHFGVEKYFDSWWNFLVELTT